MQPLMSIKKILFCGTPDFAALHLKAILSAFPSLELQVLSRPDAPKGRGRKETVSPVKQVALDHHFPVATPHTKAELSTYVKTFNPDLIIVVAYGMIFPKELTDHYLCVNVHGSLLPAYRGASPIQASLLNNDLKTGITLIQMNEKMDEGDILGIAELPILETDNFQTLHDRLADCGTQLLLSFIQKFPTMTRLKQDHQEATYCSKLSKADTILNPEDTLLTKLGKVRAFSPTPGATWIHNGKRIKILSAKSDGQKLIPLIVKPEGKGEMSYADYQRGYGDLDVN